MVFGAKTTQLLDSEYHYYSLSRVSSVNKRVLLSRELESLCLSLLLSLSPLSLWNLSFEGDWGVVDFRST